MFDPNCLNHQQRAAIEHYNGPLVVFAGAGSGKTMVITHRVAHLVNARHVPPWRILAVTFTNKAANEMRQRLAALLQEDVQDLWVGTFHAICAKLLRRHAEPCGVRRDFVIYDDQDQQAVLKRLVREFKLDEKRYSPKLLAWHINRSKQEGIGHPEFISNSRFEEIVHQIYVAYEKRLQKANALDFGDLIFRLVRVMDGNEQLRKELQHRYDHILVDEFQDTNRVQFRFVHDLSMTHQNLCVVGDDDQSIYRWRGADRRNILDFSRHFNNARLIKLEQNYRSTKRILQVANAVISHNLDREAKTLWTSNTEGAPISILSCLNERDEAQTFIRRTYQLLEKGYHRSDIALLYRVHAQSRVFEEALRAANIPYRIVGGIRFYDRAEVKDVIAYLRVLSNPDDDVSLLRIINTPTRGIGKTTVNRLLDAAAQTGRSVWETTHLDQSSSILNAAASKKVQTFVNLISSLQKMVEDNIGLTSITETILNKTGYIKTLENEDSIEADVKLENIKELVGSIHQFEQSIDEPTLSNFLELVTLHTDLDQMTDNDAVTLMTIHAAKGLEFPAVIVAGLEEGIFPRVNKNDIDEYEDQLEEERRLAYVAFTRAKQHLVLSHTLQRSIYGETRSCQPSRFLAEISGRVSGHDLLREGVSREIQPRKEGLWNKYINSERNNPFPSHAKSEVQSTTQVAGDSYIDRTEGSDLNSEVRFGMRVRHKMFGMGQVEKISPGNPPSVIVKFDSFGKKTIKANFLTPV